jgi:hypothetical protein
MWFSTAFNSCMSSFVWTTHRTTNGLTSRLHFGTIIPFPTWSLMKYLNPSCSNFIMLWLKGKRLAYNLTNIPNLLISFPGLFHITSNTTWITHPSIIDIPWCMCTHPINFMGIYLFCCAHGNKHTWTHDAIHDTFVAIVHDVNSHMGWKQFHVLPSNTFNFFRQWVNIVFTKNGISTLTNVVITDPMWVDLLPWSCAIQRFVAFNVAQTKKRSYCDQHLDTPLINSSP